MNIIVTGGSRGIGKELVLELAQTNTNKVIVISRTATSVEELNSFKNIYPISFDLTNGDFSLLYDSINNIVGGRVDILVNNSGHLVHRSILDISDQEIETTFNVNLFGVIKLIRKLFPLLKKEEHENRSHILNISSMGGFQGSVKFDGLSIYSSSKAALANLSECLALELSNHNISVNALALGAVQTEMLSKAFPEYEAPLSSKEMAKFISYFAVNGNKFFNGKVIPVSLSTP